MIKCHTKQWGNSLGIILPKKAVQQYHLRPHEDIVIEIKEKTGNVLKELFGSHHFSKPTPPFCLKKLEKSWKENYEMPGYLRAS